MAVRVEQLEGALVVLQLVRRRREDAVGAVTPSYGAERLGASFLKAWQMQGTAN